MAGRTESWRDYGGGLDAGMKRYGMAQDARIFLESTEEGALDEGTALASIRLDEAPVNGTSAPRKDEQELLTDGHQSDDKPPKVPEKLYSPILHYPTTTTTPVIRQGPLKVDPAVDGPIDNLSS